MNCGQEKGPVIFMCMFQLKRIDGMRISPMEILSFDLNEGGSSYRAM